jgi:hypothetical protein
MIPLAVQRCEDYYVMHSTEVALLNKCLCFLRTLSSRHSDEAVVKLL